MKRIVQLLLIILLTQGAAQAQQWRQQRNNRPAADRIHAAKMAYITDRLHLSANQSGSFIPLYNEYEQEVVATRRSFRNKYKGHSMDSADDATSRQFIDDDLDYQQQVLDLKRRYNDRFLKVLSPQQLAELYKAEREFRQMLQQRLKDRRGNGGGRRGW